MVDQNVRHADAFDRTVRPRSLTNLSTTAEPKPPASECSSSVMKRVWFRPARRSRLSSSGLTKRMLTTVGCRRHRRSQQVVGVERRVDRDSRAPGSRPRVRDAAPRRARPRPARAVRPTGRWCCRADSALRPARRRPAPHRASARSRLRCAAPSASCSAACAGRRCRRAPCASGRRHRRSRRDRARTRPADSARATSWTI